jgi:hypothetical protein
LLEACSVPSDQVVRILEQWHELDVNRHQVPAPAKPDDVAGTAEAPLDANGESVAVDSAAAGDDVAGYSGDVAVDAAPDLQVSDDAEGFTWLELAVVPVLGVGVAGVLAGIGVLTPGWALAIVLFIAVVSAIAVCRRWNGFARGR